MSLSTYKSFTSQFLFNIDPYYIKIIELKGNLYTLPSSKQPAPLCLYLQSVFFLTSVHGLVTPFLKPNLPLVHWIPSPPHTAVPSLMTLCKLATWHHFVLSPLHFSSILNPYNKYNIFELFLLIELCLKFTIPLKCELWESGNFVFSLLYLHCPEQFPASGRRVTFFPSSSFQQLFCFFFPSLILPCLLIILICIYSC